MRDFIYFITHLKSCLYYFFFLRNSRKWDRQKMQDWQLKKIAELWDYASIHVPYYKRIADALNIHKISSWDDFYKLPVLTKDIVRNNFDDLCADNLPSSRFVKNSTSGSTGSNFYFYSDYNQHHIYDALLIRKFAMMGLRFSSCKKMIIWGSSFDVKKINKRKFSKLKLWLTNTYVFSEYDLSENNMEHLCEWIIKNNPDSIQSYPSILERIAVYANANGIYLNVPVIHTGGEKTYDYQRKLIEDTFKCHLYDFYGGRDMPFIGMSCKESDKIHVFQENLIFEVLDDDGNLVNNGEGNIILTNLHNQVMPFIRYSIGDRAKVSENPGLCKCGATLQQIDEIVGRKFEILSFRGGYSVGGTFWTLLLRSVKGILDFQVIQESEDSVTIKFIQEKGYLLTDEGKENIINQIHKYCGPEVTVKFLQIEELPRTSSGKRQFVISNL